MEKKSREKSKKKSKKQQSEHIPDREKKSKKKSKKQQIIVRIWLRFVDPNAEAGRQRNLHEGKSDDQEAGSSIPDMENKSKTQQSEQNLYEIKSDAPEAGSSIPDMENKSKTQQSEQNLHEGKSDDQEAGSSIPDMENKSKTQQSEQDLHKRKSDDQESGSSIPDMENKSKTQQSDKNLYEIKSDAPEAGSSIPDMENKSKTQQSEQLKQMEKFYKKRLQEQVSAAKRIKEEFESFKDRVALDMAVSIKTGDTESMNDPVSKTKLTEMYDSLRLEEWIGIKDCLKNSEISPAFLSALIERTFKDAAEEMERKKRKIEKAFGSSAGHEKVKENKQLAVHNLQIALYHSHKEDPLKSPFPKYDGEKAEDMMVNLRHLTSECHWLGGLLALNNPPLQPDWKTHDGKNSWDIFPHGLI